MLEQCAVLEIVMKNQNRFLMHDLRELVFFVFLDSLHVILFENGFYSVGFFVMQSIFVQKYESILSRNHEEKRSGEHDQ